MNVDIIILSYCKDNLIYTMNKECIDSLNTSETDFRFNVKIIESNNQFDIAKFPYPNNVEVIKPEKSFNYNEFLNIGIASSSNTFICFSNNDVIFHKGWCSQMMYAKAKNPNLKSFCPIDPDTEQQPENLIYNIGYDIRREFKGWCFLVERVVFEKTGLFDERFSFFFQDDDFAMLLRKYEILNCVVYSSHVNHLGSKNTRSRPEFSFETRSAKDRKLYHSKWGSQRLLSNKIRLIRLLHRLGIKGVSKYIL